MKSEFLISDIKTGQLNAMVKNIMKQTGINNPEEVVRMINAGEVQISVNKPKWREENGVIYFSVTSDGTTGEQWIARLENNKINVCDRTKSILLSDDFKATKGITTEIAVLKGQLFTDNARTTLNIRKEAEIRKFTAPNAEVACLIREMFSDQDLEDMGLTWMVVMHEAIKDSDGAPILFNVNRNDNGRWLSTNYLYSVISWYVDYDFAFAISQVELES